MLKTVEAYLARLAGWHEEIEQAIRGLPAGALDWTPGPDMNSLAVLVTHLTGAERYWIGDVVAHDPLKRDRAAEFQVHDLDEATLLGRLAANLAYARRTLEPLALEDLEAGRVSPRDGANVTVADALLHALDHTALHAGHVQITRQLWNQRKP
jgi:uncharacterized damage-inducible protein DinB